VTREQVAEWVRGYERAWRTPWTDALRELFADDATYRMSPFEEPHAGLAAIGKIWDKERTGPDEAFTMASEIVALEGDTAVVRVEVEYGDRPTPDYRDLWVIRFDGDGRCVSFEEWPFWPGKDLHAPGSPTA
jgi:SnoaL-like domain